MATIGMALDFAMLKHGRQVDKGGEPYIGHLLRVAARVCYDQTAIIVALLHDVLEDTETDGAEIRELFGVEVWRAVDTLTRRPTENYHNFIERIADGGDLPIRVKLADIADNLDESRPGFSKLRTSHVVRYRRAVTMLEQREMAKAK